MSAILIVGEDEELRRRIQPHGAETVSWAGFSGRIQKRAGEGVAVLNLTDPAALPLGEAARLPDRYPGLRALYVLETIPTLSASARRRLTRPGVDILTRHADRAEFEYRLTRLLETRAGETRIPMPAPPLRRLMPEPHDPASGRLDARRLADWFGLPLTTLARALGRGYTTVHRTPDARTLQEGLHVYLRIASALNRLLGPAAARVWLHAPNPDLGNDMPRTLMEQGTEEAEVVAELLEDSLLGMPG